VILFAINRRPHHGEPALHPEFRAADVKGRGKAYGKTKAAVYETLKVAALVFLVLLTLVPIYIMLNLSFKTAGQILKSYWSVSFPLHGFNYRSAWKYVSRYIGNSIKVSGITVVIVVFSTALSAYAFAKLKFIGSKLLYAAILGLMMMPQVITFIPRFVIARDLKILYTQWGLILPYAAAAQSFAVFLLHSFFTQLPSELIESARIDGTSEIQCFIRIVLPISVPILTTVGIMNFMTTWDQFLWPLVCHPGGQAAAHHGGDPVPRHATGRRLWSPHGRLRALFRSSRGPAALHHEVLYRGPHGRGLESLIPPCGSRNDA